MVRIPIAGCWLWAGAVDPNGYGRFRDQGKTVLAHRFAYEHFIAPIPVGMYLCHLCDTPACCNPAHLEVGTQTDNMRQAVQRGRTDRGESRPQSVLTADDVRRIRAMTGTHLEIAMQFGISQPTASKIIRRATWRHIK